ncbi:hypothetical protein PG987_000103 [Apiospora arundinis]
MEETYDNGAKLLQQLKKEAHMRLLGSSDPATPTTTDDTQSFASTFEAPCVWRSWNAPHKYTTCHATMPTTASVWKAGSPQTTWSARYVGSLWLVTNPTFFFGVDEQGCPVYAEMILSPQPIRPRSTPVGSLFDNFVVRPATPLLPSASAKDTVWRDGQQAISSRSACRILYRACVLGSVDDITRVMDCHRFDKDSLRGPTLRAADGGFVNCVRCLTDRLSSDECSNFDELMVEVALVAVRRGDLDMLDLVVDVVCKHDTALFCEWVLP